MKLIKKFLVSIIALVMSVGVFGFVACDQGNDSSNNEDNTLNVEDSTGDKDGEEDKDNDLKTILTEDTNFGALISEKVSEDEWENVFADNSKYSNCTLKYIYESFDSLTETQTTDIYYTKYQTVDNELYFLQSDNHSDDLVYVHCVDGSIYGYQPGQNTNWMVMLDPDGEVIFEGGYAPYYNWMASYRIWCPDFGAFFECFTYNEELGQYEFLGNDTDYISTNSVGYYDGKLSNYRNATVKIINGRVAYLAFGNESCYFYDFNNSAFDIPNL